MAQSGARVSGGSRAAPTSSNTAVARMALADRLWAAARRRSLNVHDKMLCSESSRRQLASALWIDISSHVPDSNTVDRWK